MKRRNFLMALGVVPPLVLEACKGDQLPKIATIIKATVTDEKGKPIGNIPFKFYGYRNLGGSVAGGGKKEDTFRIEKSSDNQGSVELSQVVPETTTTVYFSMGDTFIYAYYTIKARKNGVIVGTGSETIDVYDSYDNSIKLGETNEYEITLTKK